MIGPTLSVLVVSYATRDLLRRCLASLEAARARGEVEVIVADNASPVEPQAPPGASVPRDLLAA